MGVSLGRSVVVVSSQFDEDSAQQLAESVRALGFYVICLTDLADAHQVRMSIHHNLGPGDYVVLLLSEHLKESWLQEVHENLSNEMLQRSISLLPVKLDKILTPTFLRNRQVLNASNDRRKTFQMLISRLALVKDLDLKKLSPEKFEQLALDLLRSYGFKMISSRTYDSNYDAMAKYERKDPFGRLVEETWLIEIKSGRSVSDVRSLMGLFGYAHVLTEPVNVLFITGGQLTSTAREWLDRSRNRLNIRIIERDELQQLLLSKPKVMSKYLQYTDGRGTNA